MVRRPRRPPFRVPPQPLACHLRRRRPTQRSRPRAPWAGLVRARLLHQDRLWQRRCRQLHVPHGALWRPRRTRTRAGVRALRPPVPYRRRGARARARQAYFRDLLLTLTVAPGAILPVNVRRPFRPATVCVNNIARWHGPPSGAVAPGGRASTDDDSCGSDGTSVPPPLMDASDTSSDDDSDDSSGWGSLFSGCTDASPDGPGLCGRPFGHSSCQPPAFIDVGVRPARLIPTVPSCRPPSVMVP